MADNESTRRALAIENARKDAEALKMGEAYRRSLTNTPEAPKSAASAPAKPEDKKPKTMKRGGCAKKYAEGGVTEGENKNIDDDTRMRARAAMARRLAGEEDGSPAPAVKRSAPKAEAKPGPSGRPRENVAPSGRGAAGAFAEKSTRYPTAAERGAEIRKSLADAEEENVRKRNERAESGKSSLSDFMTGFKRRFGTQAMREEAGMKSGGCAKSYAKGGSVRGGGCERQGKTKGRFI